MATWISHPDSYVFVAVDETAILGVAAMTNAGEITLNYVSPSARHRGISKALIGHLESKARELGLNRCTLKSTETAKNFYLSQGYQQMGPPVGGFGMTGGYPMAKHWE